MPIKNIIAVRHLSLFSSFHKYLWFVKGCNCWDLTVSLSNNNEFLNNEQINRAFMIAFKLNNTQENEQELYKKK